jgi:hypothetical protein
MMFTRARSATEKVLTELVDLRRHSDRQVSTSSIFNQKGSETVDERDLIPSSLLPAAPVDNLIDTKGIGSCRGKFLELDRLGSSFSSDAALSSFEPFVGFEPTSIFQLCHLRERR